MLICTSGTAVANYLPAVIEADVHTIPMLILSADRPPELKQTGANQTIDQFNVLSEYIRWKFDLPCPDEKLPPQMALTTVDQAIFRFHGTAKCDGWEGLWWRPGSQLEGRSSGVTGTTGSRRIA